MSDAGSEGSFDLSGLVDSSFRKSGGGGSRAGSSVGPPTSRNMKRKALSDVGSVVSDSTFKGRLDTVDEGSEASSSSDGELVKQPSRRDVSEKLNKKHKRRKRSSQPAM